MKEKIFKVKNINGSIAKFIFKKPKGSIWYWDLPNITPPEEKILGVRSIPLPGIELDKLTTLKECLSLIKKINGENYTNQIIVDIMQH